MLRLQRNVTETTPWSLVQIAGIGWPVPVTVEKIAVIGQPQTSRSKSACRDTPIAMFCGNMEGLAFHKCPAVHNSALAPLSIYTAEWQWGELSRAGSLLSMFKTPNWNIVSIRQSGDALGLHSQRPLHMRYTTLVWSFNFKCLKRPWWGSVGAASSHTRNNGHTLTLCHLYTFVLRETGGGEKKYS